MPSNSVSNIDGRAAEASKYICTSSTLDTAPDGLVLLSYGGGFAWFRPSEEPAEADEARWTLTEAGTRALRMAEVFGTAEPEGGSA